jgi:hypothetical protein
MYSAQLYLYILVSTTCFFFKLCFFRLFVRLSVCLCVSPSLRSHFRNRYVSFYWKKWLYICYMACNILFLLWTPSCYLILKLKLYFKTILYVINISKIIKLFSLLYDCLNSIFNLSCHCLFQTWSVKIV